MPCYLSPGHEHRIFNGLTEGAPYAPRKTEVNLNNANNRRGPWAMGGRIWSPRYGSYGHLLADSPACRRYGKPRQKDLRFDLGPMWLMWLSELQEASCWPTTKLSPYLEPQFGAAQSRLRRSRPAPHSQVSAESRVVDDKHAAKYRVKLGSIGASSL